MSMKPLLSVFLITLSLFPHSATAAPVGAIKGRPVAADSTFNAAAPVEVLDVPARFTPVTQLPGAIGTVKYSSDGRCILVVLGGSGTAADTNALFGGVTSASIRPLGKNYFAVLMCPNESQGTRMIVSNASGLKKVLAGKGKVKEGSLFVIDWDKPNMLASGVLANTHSSGGSKFLTEDYEMAFGTQQNGEAYFFIVDKIESKIIAFSQVGGAYYGNFDSDTKALYARTIGTQLLSAPRIIIAN